MSQRKLHRGNRCPQCFVKKTQDHRNTRWWQTLINGHIPWRVWTDHPWLESGSNRSQLTDLLYIFVVLVLVNQRSKSHIEAGRDRALRWQSERLDVKNIKLFRMHILPKSLGKPRVRSSGLVVHSSNLIYLMHWELS